MTPSDRQRLRELAEKASSGPWRASGGTVWQPSSPDDPTDFSGRAVSFTPNENGEHIDPDAAYIAAASPSTVLSLLRELDALTARVGELRDYLMDDVVGRMCEWVVTDGGDRCKEPGIDVRMVPNDYGSPWMKAVCAAHVSL